MKKLCILLLFLVTNTLWAQTITWSGSAGSGWNEPANWSPFGSTPGANSEVIIPARTYNPVINGNVRIKKLTMADDAVITINGRLTITNTAAENVTMNNSSGIIVNGNLIINGESDGMNFNENSTLNINAGGALTLVTSGSNAIKLNNQSVLTNNGTMQVSATSASIFVYGDDTGTEMVKNYGRMDLTGQIEKYTDGFRNYSCGRIYLNTGDLYNNGGTFTNDGLFIINNNLSDNANTFTNNGIIKIDASGTFTDNETRVLNSSTGNPVFSFASGNSAVVNGIYTDSLTTTTAGTYIQGTNTFTASGLPTGVQTLYAKITLAACTYVVPFTYDNTDITPPPTIIINTQPKDVLLCSTSSGSVRFTISASGASSYQWQKYNTSNGMYEDLSEGGVFSGVTTNALVIADVSGLLETDYQCKLTNGPEELNSSSAAIVPLFSRGGGAVLHPTQSVSTATISLQVGYTGKSFEYSIDNGGNWQSSPQFLGVPVNNYNVRFRVADSLSCTFAYHENPLKVFAYEHGTEISPITTPPTLLEYMGGFTPFHANGYLHLEYLNNDFVSMYKYNGSFAPVVVPSNYAFVQKDAFEYANVAYMFLFDGTNIRYTLGKIKSDNTVEPIALPEHYSLKKKLGVYNGVLYLSCSNQLTSVVAIAKFNGTNLTVVEHPEADINNENVIEFGGNLYMVYKNRTLPSKNQLMKYDGTTFTLIADPMSGVANGGVSGSFIVYNNMLYLGYSIGNTMSLARFNGTTISIVANPANYRYIGRPVIYGSQLYLSYENTLDYRNIVAKHDGTNLTFIPNPTLPTAMEFLQYKVVVNNKLLLLYKDFSSDSRGYLATYDGSSLQLLTLPSDFFLNTLSPEFFIYNDELYFNVIRGDNGSLRGYQWRLAKYDGTSIETILNPDGYAASRFGFINRKGGFAKYDGKLFFGIRNDNSSGDLAVLGDVCEPPTINDVAVSQSICTTLGGGITITATGIGILQYSIDNATWQDSHIFTNRSIGNYTIRVRYKTNPTCIATYSGNPVSITQVATATEIMTWTGNISTDWNSACNWSPYGIPSATNPVLIGDRPHDPVIFSGMAVAKNISLVGTNASLTINNGATLTVAAATNTLMSIASNATVTNYGTLNISNLTLDDLAYQTLRIGANSSLYNYGTISIASPQNIGLVIDMGGGSFTNKTGAILTINAELGISNTGSLINETGATINGTANSYAIYCGKGQVDNYGLIDMAGLVEVYTLGTVFNNRACATLKITKGFFVHTNATANNWGYIELKEELHVDGEGSEAFYNYGVLKSNGILNTALFVNNANTGIIVKNAPDPIFTYTGTYNGTISGIFTDAAATTSAGTFALPNTFTPNSNVIEGSQTLYAKIIPHGDECEYIVPFTYILCNEVTASISYTGTPYCKSEGASDVTLAGTSGGTFTSAPSGLTINSTTGQITPGSSTAGTYTVTYTIAASGGCASATATTSVTINNIPSASIRYAGTPYCNSAGAANVIRTGTAGGTFTSAPVGLTINSSTGQITPGSSTVGTYTVTYTIASSGGCASVTATTNVTIINNPTASINYAGTPYCKSEVASSVTLTGTSGGTFTSMPVGLTINSSSGEITPGSSTAGTYKVNYSTGSTGSCANVTATTSVTINDVPSAGIRYAATPYCKTASAANVIIVGTTGGTFTAAPVGLTINPSTGQITPGSSTSGTYTVTYTMAASGCAAATATTNVTITEQPSASISYEGSPYCITAGASDVTLTGSSGGYFSSTPAGLSINPSSGEITPSNSAAGVYTISYTIAGSGGCAPVVANTLVTITETPSASISYAGSPYCQSESASNVTRTGSPGGRFTSAPAGLSMYPLTGQIIPSSSALGTYTVTYTIAASGGCASATSTTSVTIINNPSASISYTGSPYCKSTGASNVTLTGSSGGTFTSAPVGLTINSSSGQITPSSSALGTYTVTYTIAASGGCASATSTTSVTIINNPSASISYAGSPYCKSTGASNVTLAGSSGGTFTSAPVGLTINSSTGQITPSSSTSGTYTVTYTIAASGGCASATATANVTITNNPSASISYTGSPYCKSAGASNVTLTGSSGGTFTSAPVGLTINSSSGQITPSSSTSGTYTVTYTIAASGGCTSATATANVTITNNPSASISYTGSPYCKSAGASNVTLAGSSGGTFTSAPVGLAINSTSGQITPSSSTSGTYTVTYTIAASGGCASATATANVTITNNPSASISYAGTPYCKSAGASNVTRTGSSGGTFTSAPVGLTLNSSSGQITPSSSTSGAYTITYTIAASGGCASATATANVTITNNPTASISYAGTPYCKSAGASNVTLTGSSGGTFTASPVGLIINSSSGQITPSSSTAGTYTVTYTIAASGGCASATATANVTITNNPTASISYAGTPYCKSAGASNVTLTGSSGGTFTASPVGLIINSSSGQITPSSSTSGTYTVTYTIAASGGCASATATANVTITNNPSASISYTGSPYCKSAGASNVTLTGSSGGTFTASPVGLTLNSSSGQITPSSSTAGTYTVTYTIAASGGCTSATATANVTITNNPSASITGIDNLSCTNTSVIRTANGGTTYLWSNGLGTNATATITSPGTYTVTVTGTSGCTATATTQVVATNNLSATASNTGPYSISQTIQLNATGGGSYVWSGPNNFTSNIANPTIANALTANSGIYTVTVTHNGCSASATTQVIVTGIDPCTQIIDLRYVKSGSPYQLMFSLRDGMNIQYTSDLVSIMAVPICPNVPIGSVDLTIAGPNLNWTILQNVEPFTIFDNLANSFNGRELPPGTYTFTVTGYPEDNRIGGTVYGPVVTTFTIVGNSAAISAPTVGNTNLCAGGNMNVSFSTTGSFAGGNEFQVQLSDINGSFVTPTIIGITNTAGNVICQIPQSVSGNGYLIRVVSTNQVIAGNPINTILSVTPSAKNFVSDVNGGIITEQASQRITATHKILSPANVSYRAGKSIELNPGFIANNGTIFKAEIGGCSN